MSDKYEHKARVVNVLFLLHNEAEDNPGPSFIELSKRAGESLRLYSNVFIMMWNLSLLDQEDKEYLRYVADGDTAGNLKAYQDWMIIDAYMRRLKLRKRADGENNYGR